MRIACPGCNAAYDVPPESLVPGRGVRCARCGVVWTPVATVDAEPDIAPLPERGSFAPEPPRPAEPAPEPKPDREPERPAPEPAPDREVDAVAVSAPLRAPTIELVRPRPKPQVPAPAPGPVPVTRSRTPPVLLGWLVTAALLAGFAWFAIMRRADIVHAWPPSERAYHAVGLR